MPRRASRLLRAGAASGSTSATLVGGALTPPALLMSAGTSTSMTRSSLAMSRESQVGSRDRSSKDARRSRKASTDGMSPGLRPRRRCTSSKSRGRFWSSHRRSRTSAPRASSSQGSSLRTCAATQRWALTRRTRATKPLSFRSQEVRGRLRSSFSTAPLSSSKSCWWSLKRYSSSQKELTKTRATSGVLKTFPTFHSKAP
mmetsp:Transcript_68091/g.211529  ORF Transcript_68091/g.211529 Transcript_68091/m.211529 type:complete len:200 (-) Transcript_68091:697-1296(-)